MSILMKFATSFAGQQLFVAPKRATNFGRHALNTKATLNKSDLVNVVSEKAYITQKQAQEAVNVFLDSIVESVAKGEKVKIPGFGTFERRVRAARKGRNPRTGESLDIPESTSPAFSAGKSFKDAVKGANDKK